ncbi:hypothetical protein NDU88_002027 [Pleurodeles waltl]|uniref:Uncharacterized protein n=1 Tax=Pleurodeles waltl TaxID=8319 RepID=A0AAV7T1D4_PLEWA|nr:hypothetical protein NDU88_002027 [Pleurodeles waltl]
MKRREECHRGAPQEENAVEETSRASPEQREQRTIGRKREADRPATFWEERSPVRYRKRKKAVSHKSTIKKTKEGD